MEAGQLLLSLSDKTPKGYILAAGQSLSINGNESLYEVIGDQYTSTPGDSFNLPNLQNFYDVGQGRVTIKVYPYIYKGDH